jgi:hypothetical protein
MTPAEDNAADRWPDKETFRALAFLLAYGRCRSELRVNPWDCEATCRLACEQAATESAEMTRAFYARQTPTVCPGESP